MQTDKFPPPFVPTPPVVAKPLTPPSRESESPEPPEKERDSCWLSVARLLSIIFSPLLMPTYVVAASLWLTYLNVTPLRSRIMVLSAVFAFSCMLPLITICFLRAVKAIKSTSLFERRDRVIPYFISMLTYIGLAIYLHRLHAPDWLAAFFVGTAVAALINVLVNFSWKISGHSTGMGGLVAMALFAVARHLSMSPYQWWWIIIAVLVAGTVMSSRLALRCHTPAQVAAGFFTGLIAIGIPVFMWG